VNTAIAGDQSDASVSLNADASFVVTWNSAGQDDGNTWGVFGQRFDSTGSVVGGEFQVATTSANDQMNSSVAINDQGDYVVIWSGNRIGDSDGIFGILYE
jgi:hypothetical protein